MSRDATPSTTTRLGRAAAAIAPLLNRVVFTGRDVLEALITDKAVAVRRTVLVSPAVRVLSSSTLDRIGADLLRLGLRRGSRLPAGDQWIVDDQTVLELSYVPEAVDSAAPWLEYATLLTLPLVVGEGCTARITGAPALLALAWASYDSAGEHPLDSEALEDAAALVGGRTEIERELMSTTPELRAFVASHAAWFSTDDNARHVIRATFPDAARLPALVTRIVDRFRRIAGLG